MPDFNSYVTYAGEKEGKPWLCFQCKPGLSFWYKYNFVFFKAKA